MERWSSADAGVPSGRLTSLVMILRVLPRSRPTENDAYWAHRYFTDGRELFRLVDRIYETVGCVVGEFENCRSLETVLIRIDALTRGSFQPVAAAGA